MPSHLRRLRMTKWIMTTVAGVATAVIASSGWYTYGYGGVTTTGGYRSIDLVFGGWTIIWSHTNIDFSKLKTERDRRFFAPGMEWICWPLPPDKRGLNLLGLPNLHKSRMDRRLVIPPWLSLLILGIPSGILWRRDRPMPPGHCPRCRYNLTGNTTGVCPECGLAIKPSLAQPTAEIS